MDLERALVVQKHGADRRRPVFTIGSGAAAIEDAMRWPRRWRRNGIFAALDRYQTEQPNVKNQ
jgi:hypothetical protein